MALHDVTNELVLGLSKTDELLLLYQCVTERLLQRVYKQLRDYNLGPHSTEQCPSVQ